MKQKQKPETILIHRGEEEREAYGAVIPPIYQNSLYDFNNWDEIAQAFKHRLEKPIYSRQLNPTVDLVEKKLAHLANGEKAKLFPSGMAAVTAGMLHYLNPGDHVIAIQSMYGPANNLLDRYLKVKLGIKTTFIQGVSISEFENARRENTRLIYLESPSSAVFGLQDIEAVSEFARKRHLNSFIDNSWATPLFQAPLDLGIDMEMHSCSKYLGGHSDLVCGVLIGNKADIESIHLNESELLGAKMAPFEAWLLLRSLRTLVIRMQKHQTSAMKIAKFLEDHPSVDKVYYPGLASHPQYELGKKQMTGYSGLMGFRLKTEDLDAIKGFVNKLKLFKLGVSWGGHESLVYAPAISYGLELSPENFKARGIGLSDIRISVGLEGVEDLMEDLEQAFGFFRRF